MRGTWSVGSCQKWIQQVLPTGYQGSHFQSPVFQVPKFQNMGNKIVIRNYRNHNLVMRVNSLSGLLKPTYNDIHIVFFLILRPNPFTGTIIFLDYSKTYIKIKFWDLELPPPPQAGILIWRVVLMEIVKVVVKISFLELKNRNHKLRSRVSRSRETGREPFQGL